MLAVILNQHLIKKERAGRMQNPRIPPHPTTKQGILFLRLMGFPAQKKMNQEKRGYKAQLGAFVTGAGLSGIVFALFGIGPAILIGLMCALYIIVNILST